MNYNYVDPIQWIVYGGIISAVLCVGIAILWVEIQKEKWIDLGRELEQDSKQPKFRKTKGYKIAPDKTVKQPPSSSKGDRE